MFGPAGPPLTHGSHRSKLVDQIRKDPCRANLTREEFIKTVTLIDAIRIMMRNGPSGGRLSDVAMKNTLILSSDPVAADTLAAGLFGYEPGRLGFIRLGQKRGLGTSDLEQLDRKKVIL